MFSLELQGQTSQDKHGGIRLNTTYVTSKKPLWLVAIKLAVLVGMLALASCTLGPILAQWLVLWKALAATVGIILIYIGVAFFVRPEASSDNMGWFGGLGNDPFQYSDNINRFLFKLHMLLGPGRFAAETLLDLCALLGLARGAEVTEESSPSPSAALAPPAAAINPSRYSLAAVPIPEQTERSPLRADRFEG
jgi:hypothetical protein